MRRVTHFLTCLISATTIVHGLKNGRNLAQVGVDERSDVSIGRESAGGSLGHTQRLFQIEQWLPDPQTSIFLLDMADLGTNTGKNSNKNKKIGSEPVKLSLEEAASIFISLWSPSSALGDATPVSAKQTKLPLQLEGIQLFIVVGGVIDPQSCMRRVPDASIADNRTIHMYDEFFRDLWTIRKPGARNQFYLSQYKSGFIEADPMLQSIGINKIKDERNHLDLIDGLELESSDRELLESIVRSRDSRPILDLLGLLNFCRKINNAAEIRGSQRLAVFLKAPDEIMSAHGCLSPQYRLALAIVNSALSKLALPAGRAAFVLTPPLELNTCTKETIASRRRSMQHPGCYTSKLQCELGTNNCSNSHGACVRKQQGGESADCFHCVCQKTREDGKTFYWGGRDCSKQNISFEFNLIVVTVIVGALLIAWSISLLWSIGSESGNVPMMQPKHNNNEELEIL